MTLELITTHTGPTNTVLGVGLGYREPFATDIARSVKEIDFLEFIGDSLFDGRKLELALEASAGRPCVCHFLGNSLATDAPLSKDYMDAMRRVMEATGAQWASDHLAITSVPGIEIGHLSPPILDRRTVRIVSDKIKSIQDGLGKQFLIENISYLFAAPGAELTEADVISQVCALADCGLLLDLNNLHVNATNHEYDPIEFLRGLPLDRACQIHIAGSAMIDELMIDTHAHPVPDQVFDLLAFVRRHGGGGAVLLERDRNFPVFDEILSEINRTKKVWSEHAPTGGPRGTTGVQS